MSDTLGKLVLDFEARIANLESDLGRAQRVSQQNAKAIQKAYEDSFKRVEELAHKGAEGIIEGLSALTGLTPGALGLTALIGGLGELTKTALESGDQLNKMSQRTGINVAQLSGYTYAAKLADVQTSDFGLSVEKLARNVAAAGNGSKEQAAAFNAIGVSVKNADGSLRPMGEILGDIAQKFSGYKDSAEKTALAQALFGKSGAAMIPFLNAGRDGLADMAKEAKALGYDFADIAKPSEEFNDNLSRMGAAATGLGIDIARELLPSLIAGEERVLDFIKSARESGTLQELATGIGLVAQNLDTLLVLVGSRLVFAGLVSGATAAAAAVETLGIAAAASAASMATAEGVLALLGGPAGILAIVAAGVYFLATQEDVAESATDRLAEALARVKVASQESLPQMRAQTVAALDMAAASLKAAEAELARIEATNSGLKNARGNAPGALTFDMMGVQLATNVEKTTELRENIAKLHEEIGRGRAVLGVQNDLLAEMGEETKKTAPNVSNLTDKTKEKKDADEKAAAAARELVQAQKGLDDILDQIAGGTDKAAKAQADYAKGLRDLQAKAEAAAIAGDDVDGVIRKWQKGETGLAANLKQTNAEIAKQADVAGQFLADIARDSALADMSDKERAVEEAVDRATDAWKRQAKEFGESTMAESLDKVQERVRAGEQAFQDHLEAVKKDRDVMTGWVNVIEQAATQAFDKFNDALLNGGSLLKGLGDVAKQTVNAILSQFEKLAFINPLLNSIFGAAAGGGSMLPTLANAAGGLFGGGASTGAGAALDFTSTAGGETQNSIMSPSSWIMAGKSLWSGFSNGFSSIWSGNAYNPASANFVGPPVEGQAFGPQYGGYNSGFGQALGVAGGAYAAYGEYQRGGGIAGAAAYGAGTYALGAGVAGVAAGTGFAAGVGGAFAAVPVIGWVALIAMVLDMATGGGLFGTDANKFQHGETHLGIADTGASLSIGADYKGKKALFGGSYHEWKDIPATQEQIDAANAFYDAIKKNADSFAKAFHTQLGTLVGGEFSQIFDKKGNVTDSSFTIGGIKYEHGTQEQFAEVLQAANEVATLKKIGADVTGYTNQFVKDADAFAQAAADAANTVAMAQQDIKDGIDIGGKGSLQGAFDTVQKYNTDGESESDTYSRLAAEVRDVKNGVGLLTGQKTIADIEAFVDTARRYGESLSQAYQRLEQASAQYQQFVGQFTQPATYVDDFEAALAGIYAQMQANVKQANELAKAAGAEGASEKDLANIRAYAVRQELELRKQLQQTAQSLAFSLGITTIGSLDQVNQEIADLEGRANASRSSIENFGNAVTNVAQQASDAVNLMLGNLSPLNDQEKLQYALQGMYAGSVTADQVLEIANRLYTTLGPQYKPIFDQVMAYQRNGANSTGAGVAQQAQTQDGTAPLTPAERQRLKDLKEQQAKLQGAASLGQFQTLLQQIAELDALDPDKDWKQILADMGINPDDIVKGLHLKDQKSLADAFDTQEKLLDSNNQNTTILADLLKQIRDRLPKPDGPGRSADGDPTPGNRAGRRITDDDADAIGRANARHMNALTPPGPSQRGPTPATVR